MSDRRGVLTRVLFAVAIVGAAVLLLIAPLYLDTFALRVGFAICGTAIGAIGLNILTGAAGQLSLAHAFFIAIGAVTYCYLAGDPSPASGPAGLGVSPEIALVAAVVVTSLVGLAVSPMASRLSGLNLGVASLALVFIGQWLLATLVAITGGFQGRSTPDFSLFGFPFSNSGDVIVLGVPFERFERLWYLGVVLLIACAWAARNLLRGRPGRALRMVRDQELAAAVTGIDVRAWKRHAFVLSSGFAGLAGVLFALFVGSIAPVSFTMELSVQYLVMIVIGGLGSIGGSIAGAAFVTGVPLLLQRYSEVVEVVTPALTPASLSRYIYGLVLILVLLLQPAGIAALWSRRRGLPRFVPVLRRAPHTPEPGRMPGSIDPSHDKEVTL
ncbi:branched-chain amino acid ABC transporter permease [Microbacterium sp. 22303]|uniref:branched-chain amino acid ABC transporter permease n=1 Tax=Microbacterium sp. 22303 TaxID=3453905 RepID=UPI003F82D333